MLSPKSENLSTYETFCANYKKIPACAGMAGVSQNNAISLSTTVNILKAHNVILSHVFAALHLDHNQIS